MGATPFVSPPARLSDCSGHFFGPSSLLLGDATKRRPGQDIKADIGLIEVLGSLKQELTTTSRTSTVKRLLQYYLESSRGVRKGEFLSATPSIMNDEIVTTSLWE